MNNPRTRAGCDVGGLRLERPFNDHWPEQLDPAGHSYCGETFLGPLG